MKEEGASELLTNCKQLKMTAADGKKRLTDVADTEQLLRIIQSVPSPKAEPFKAWLAMVGRERLKPQGFSASQQITRQTLEAETGKPMITSQNVADFRQLVMDIVKNAATLPEQESTDNDKKDN